MKLSVDKLYQVLDAVSQGAVSPNAALKAMEINPEVELDLRIGDMTILNRLNGRIHHIMDWYMTPNGKSYGMANEFIGKLCWDKCLQLYNMDGPDLEQWVSDHLEHFTPTPKKAGAT